MTKNANLTGPSRGPANNKKPAQLIIMAHGVGADGNDLINLATYFEKGKELVALAKKNKLYIGNAPDTF